MIKYRTVIVEPEAKSKSGLSSKRYLINLLDLELKIQATLEEFDKMGYDLFEMEPIIGSIYNSTMTQAFVLIFKSRE
jgi:hypothetical protein